MKKYFIAFVCASVALVSCNKESVKTSSSLTRSFTVVREVPGETDTEAEGKASLDGTSVVFSSGDAISVFDGTSNNKFTTTGSGGTVTFTGEAAEADRYLILSPYNENATLQSASVVNITIPDVQTATPGGVDPKALISAGIAEGDGTVTLYNAVGLVKIIVPEGLIVKSIQIGGGRGASIGICGKYRFNAATQILEPVEMTGLITLVPAEGEETIAPGSYYVAVRPKPDYNGLVIAYVDGNNVLSKRQSPDGSMIYINRGHIVPLGSLGSGYAAQSGRATLRYYQADVNVQFTSRLKTLAAGADVSGIADDNIIKKIVFKAHTLYSQDYKKDANLVSNGPNSDIQIHAWVIGDTAYVCTEAPAISFYNNSGNLLRNFVALEEVEFNDVKAMNSTSLEFLFRNDTALKKIDFGNADLSTVTNWSSAFLTKNLNTNQNGVLEYVSLGETAINSNASMVSMFSEDTLLKYLYLGKNFSLPADPNTNRLTNIFNATASQTTLILDGEGHGMQCKLYASQSLWDALCADLTDGGYNTYTGFNRNRFYFTAVD